MKNLLCGLAVLLLAAALAPVQGDTETLVCVRHGEKPELGLGQLSCQGLNRSLALPKVLIEKYGTPGYIFAPSPTPRKLDKGGDFYYIRPLATIEPTAIKCGLPVNLSYGFENTAGLKGEIQKPAYRNAVLFIAWEHHVLDDFVRDLVKTYGGHSKEVPDWPKDDFDSIFVVKITRDGDKSSVTFTHDQENLNGLSPDYP